MFKVGDIVQHKTTGKIGKIVGYGCRLNDRTYFMTLKVKPLKDHYFWQPFIEDTVNEWLFVRLDYPQLLDSGLRRRKLVA